MLEDRIICHLIVKGEGQVLMGFADAVSSDEPKPPKRQEKTFLDAAKIIPDPSNKYDGQWCAENWGTAADLWDVTREIGPDYIFYTFLSYWFPPLPLIQRLGEMFPHLNFQIGYCLDRVSVHYAGDMIVSNGKILQKFVDDNDGYIDRYPFRATDYRSHLLWGNYYQSKRHQRESDTQDNRACIDIEKCHTCGTSASSAATTRKDIMTPEVSEEELKQLINDHLESCHEECRWCFAMDLHRIKAKEIAKYDFADAMVLQLKCDRCGGESTRYFGGWGEDYMKERIATLNPKLRNEISDDMIGKIISRLWPDDC